MSEYQPPTYLSVGCNHDNLYRSLVDTRFTAAASQFCNTFITPVVTITSTVTPFTTATTSIPSVTTLTSLSTDIVVITPTVTDTTTISTQTIPTTLSTLTAVATISTEVDTSTLLTEFYTLTIQTDYVTDTVQTDTAVSTISTALQTSVTGTNTITVAAGTETFYSTVETDTVTITTAPAVSVINPRALDFKVEERAALGPIGPSLISTYGSTRVSTACSCILTAAASTSTLYVTKTAALQTNTQTEYIPTSLKVYGTVTSTETTDYTTYLDLVATSTVDVIASQTISVTATQILSTTLSSEIGIIATSTSLATYTTTLDTVATSDIDVISTSTVNIEASTTLPTTLLTTVSVVVTPTTSISSQTTGTCLSTTGAFLVMATPTASTPYYLYDSPEGMTGVSVWEPASAYSSGAANRFTWALDSNGYLMLPGKIAPYLSYTYYAYIYQPSGTSTVWPQLQPSVEGNSEVNSGGEAYVEGCIDSLTYELTVNAAGRTQILDCEGELWLSYTNLGSDLTGRPCVQVFPKVIFTS